MIKRLYILTYYSIRLFIVIVASFLLLFYFTR